MNFYSIFDKLSYVFFQNTKNYKLICVAKMYMEYQLFITLFVSHCHLPFFDILQHVHEDSFLGLKAFGMSLEVSTTAGY